MIDSRVSSQSRLQDGGVVPQEGLACLGMADGQVARKMANAWMGAGHSAGGAYVRRGVGVDARRKTTDAAPQWWAQGVALARVRTCGQVL